MLTGQPVFVYERLNLAEDNDFLHCVVVIECLVIHPNVIECLVIHPNDRY